MADRRIKNLVVKVAERCNLNCTYCYMYQHEDQSYLRRPKRMSLEVFDALLRRIAQYCSGNDSHTMHLTLHGGEPMLAGTKWLNEAATLARESLGPQLSGLSMQTNGTLLNERAIALLKQHSIKPSISLDGPPEINDLCRVDHQNRGSYNKTLRGLKLLQRHGFDPHVLCVVTPGTNGLHTYEHFRSLGVKRMNFLLPDVSHDNKAVRYARFGETPIAEYLIPIFDAWFRENDPTVVITIFWELISMIRGGPPRTDGFGNPLVDYLIIETDGSIHANDALRVCDEDVAESGLNVLDNSFCELSTGLPLAYRLINDGMPLSAICNGCTERHVCGGGNIAHRYAPANGFDNPSVWCKDIKLLLAHIRKAI